MHQKTHLQIQFEQLNLLYQFPRLYLHQFFSELKTRIDISFAKKDLLLASGHIKVNFLRFFFSNKVTAFKSIMLCDPCKSHQKTI